MDEEVKQETQSGKANPWPVVGIVVVVAVIGLLVWSSNNKTVKQNQKQTAQVQGTETTQAPTAAATASAQNTNAEQAFTVHGGNFYFKPNEIHVKKGDKVKITFTNDEGFHDFALDEFDIKTNTIPGGQTTSVEFTADKAGTFEYYCSVGNHRQMGMKGKLIVE